MRTTIKSILLDKRKENSNNQKKWIFSYNSKTNEYEEFSKHEDSDNKIISYLKTHYNFFNKVILEIGCGSGKFISDISKNAKKYYALDKSEGLLKIAQDKIYPNKQIEFIHSGAENIPLENGSIDLIFGAWALSSMGDFSNQEKIFLELKRVLKTKGKIILVENAWDNLLTKILGLSEDDSLEIYNFFVKQLKFIPVKTLDTKIKFANLEEEKTILESCFINTNFNSFLGKQKSPYFINHKVIILETKNER
jgi:ubiquinone/menaquinone biosynthesis C-methylase UbiE